ncbi:hypothetical protein LZ32DRAFT_600173 [Colletotrichum eremochloae]|nr:hypothetical protein LZ32DRAFT_600173 [Colletotrichum eremochloae]
MPRGPPRAVASFRNHGVVAVFSWSKVKWDLVPRRKGRALRVTYSHHAAVYVPAQTTGFKHRASCDQCAHGIAPEGQVRSPVWR